MNPNSRKEELKSRIVSAWSDMAYPGDEHLLRKSAIADKEQGKPYDIFDLQMEEFLLGKTWREASPGIFEICYSPGFSFLSPEAFRYYMATYLSGILEPDEVHVPVKEYFREKLYPQNHLSLSCFLELMQELTSEQKEVVRDVIAYLSPEDDMMDSADQAEAVGWRTKDENGNRIPDYWQNPDAWMDFYGDKVRDVPSFEEDPEGWLDKYGDGSQNHSRLF